MIAKGRAPTTQRRKIEVFTAGCPCCTEAVELIEFLAGNVHDVEIRDMHDPLPRHADFNNAIREPTVP